MFFYQKNNNNNNRALKERKCNLGKYAKRQKKKKPPPKNQPIHLLGLVSEVQNIIVSLSRAQLYKMLDKDTAQSRIRSSVLRT